MGGETGGGPHFEQALQLMHVQEYSQQLDFKVVLLKFVFSLQSSIFKQTDLRKKKGGVEAHSFKPRLLCDL